MKTLRIGAIILSVITSVATVGAQMATLSGPGLPDGLHLVLESELPPVATYYWAGHYSPPSPNLWAGRTDVSYYVSDAAPGKVFVDAPLMDAAFGPFSPSSGPGPMAAGEPPPPPSDGGGGGSGGGGGTPPRPGPPPGWSSLFHWLEMLRGPTSGLPGATNGTVVLVTHSVTNNLYYQVESISNLAETNAADWSLGEVQWGGSWCTRDPITQIWTNDIWFKPIPDTTLPMEFFRVISAPNEVYLIPWGVTSTAFRPDANGSGGTSVTFNVGSMQRPSEDLTVHYRISGSASNGVDYVAISSSVVITAGNFISDDVIIQPLYRTNAGFDVVATISLLPTTNYVVDPTMASISVPIMDNPAIIGDKFSTVATNIPGIGDLDYHGASNCLVLSVNWQSWPSGGSPCNLGLLFTNGTWTNWSTVANLHGEVNIATKKEGTNAGYTYFLYTMEGQIGWVSTDGRNSEPSPQYPLFWSAVPIGTSISYGDMYFDRTGLWGNELLVAEGDGSMYSGVYRLDSTGLITPVAMLPTGTPEGLLSLPDVPVTYGPWAGKLIVGDEGSQTIFAIATNGVFETWSIGVCGQKFLIIPLEQDLYCMNPAWDGSGPGSIFKVSRELFRGHEGDILAFQCTEGVSINSGIEPALIIIHWNGSSFETLPLFLKDVTTMSFNIVERGAFAPFSMAPVP